MFPQAKELDEWPGHGNGFGITVRK
jgi:hypothetical protein